MCKKNLPAVIWAVAGLALAVGTFVSKADTQKTAGPHVSVSAPSKQFEAPRLPSAATPIAVSRYSPTSTAQSVQDSQATIQSVQDSQVGLSYETFIPRPTKKGYYEPKIVPYPVGKPVAVRGYYRKDGTYVQPHFRSLPRR